MSVLLLFVCVYINNLNITISEMNNLTTFFKVLPYSILLFVCLVSGTNGVYSQSAPKEYMTTDIQDLALIYQGGVHRLDWTVDQIQPYVVHQYADGRKDWLFDGFLFLEFKDGKGYGYGSRYDKNDARKTEWLWLLDRIFEEGKSLSALDQCIENQIKEIGKPDFKHKVVIGLPEALPGQKDWGEINGKKMDFSKEEDQIQATYWYIDLLMKRFKKEKYKHLDLAGFYWVSEDVETCKDLTIPLGKYIRSLDKKFYWIPYWQAKGFERWKELGFDIAYQQPNHFFSASVPDKRLEDACMSAREHNMGMEFEFDEKALYDTKESSYNRLKAYIDYFEKNNVFEESAIAYYSGFSGFLDMAKSTNPKDHAIMDRLAKLIIDRRGRYKNLLENKTKVIAHRGFWKTQGSAQNSIAALVKADSIRCYGTEFDVWLASDDKLVLNHDDVYDGHKIETTSSEVLRTLRLSNGETMPMLEAFLDRAKKLKIKLILELKPHSSPERETKAVELILNMVKKKGLTKRVEYISFSRHAIKEFVRLAPSNTPVLYLGQDISPKELFEMKATGADYNYWAYHKNPLWLQELKDLKMTSNVWTVNNPQEMLWCIRRGFDLLTTDEPVIFQRLKKK